ncbi:hypothetical protein [Bacteroides sp.]|uniref:hypothetical protein n=1 Tax=Bacteroides sp. TaxID=29523 RepID=UPI002613D463|nr:hypothetical protein [Bacteroides sp.]MDD3039510.1 hypothetical protein [Bacteroides sp.]
MRFEITTVCGNDPSDRKLFTNTIKTHRTGIVVERNGPANMQCSVALKNLSGKGSQAKLQHVPIGGVGIDGIKPLHINIDLPKW